MSFDIGNDMKGSCRVVQCSDSESRQSGPPLLSYAVLGVTEDAGGLHLGAFSLFQAMLGPLPQPTALLLACGSSSCAHSAPFA